MKMLLIIIIILIIAIIAWSIINFSTIRVSEFPERTIKAEPQEIVKEVQNILNVLKLKLEIE